MDSMLAMRLGRGDLADPIRTASVVSEPAYIGKAAVMLSAPGATDLAATAAIGGTTLIVLVGAVVGFYVLTRSHQF